MIVDAHLHCSGNESSADILRSLDEAGVDVAVLLAPFLTDSYSLADRGSLLRANEYVASLARDAKDRMIGFAVLNPLDRNAPNDLQDAIERLGLRGLKLVPSGWYPYSDCAHALYERAEALGIPVLFHSGIFIDGKSGRFCRPVFYEAVRDHPSLRVALAHLGWPWCDEANALGLIDLINGTSPDDCQIRFDISFGPPPIYRRPALERALSVLGAGLLQFGSDRFLPCSGLHIKAAINEVSELFDSLNVSEPDRKRVMGGTAANWLRLAA